jgi:hypothetical protein
MVDRYTKMVLTVIALALTGLLGRSMLEVRAVNAQAPVCGAADTPCYVQIAGGPPGGAWLGAPLLVFDNQAEARAQAQQTCGTASSPPCFSTIVGGPGSLGDWRGVPLVVIDAQRIVPRLGP